MALILTIDDSSTTRMAIRKIVKAEGHDVMEATNGREGLEIVANHTPDCIVLDLIMPEVEGMEVLKVLYERGSKIPVIILTADIQEIVREECLEMGATAFISKPMKVEELINEIRRILDFKKEVSNGPDPRSN